MTTMLTTTATTNRHRSSATFPSLGRFDPITSWDAIRAPSAAREGVTEPIATPDRDAVD